MSKGDDPALPLTPALGRRRSEGSCRVQSGPGGLTMAAKGAIQPGGGVAPPPYLSLSSLAAKFPAHWLVPPINAGRAVAIRTTVFHGPLERHAELIRCGHHAGAQAVRREFCRVDARCGRAPA